MTYSDKVTLIITTVKSFIVQAEGDKNLNVGMKQNAHLNHQQVGTFFKHFFEKKNHQDAHDLEPHSQHFIFFIGPIS